MFIINFYVETIIRIEDKVFYRPRTLISSLLLYAHSSFVEVHPSTHGVGSNHRPRGTRQNTRPLYVHRNTRTVDGGGLLECPGPEYPSLRTNCEDRRHFNGKSKGFTFQWSYLVDLVSSHTGLHVKTSSDNSSALV